MPGSQFEDASFAVFVTNVMKTREFKDILNAVLSGTLNGWRGKSVVKSELAKHTRRIIERRLVKSGGDTKKQDLIEYFRVHLPDLINSLLQLTDGMATSLENASEAQQKAFFNDIFAVFDSKKPGDILTSLVGTIDRLHKNNPTLFADKTIQILKQVLANIDFGELKTVFDNSENDLKALITKFNDLLFEYPAKLILMLSFVPGISNYLLVFIEDLLKRFNALPADILTDLLISFFKEVDSETTGKLLNNLAEFIRQVHTGSALTGDAGTPKFSIELARKIRAVLKQMDTQLIFKAGNAIVDGKEALASSLCEAAGEDPEFPELALKHLVVKKNAKNRVAKQMIELFQEMNPEDSAAAISSGLSEWNAYDFAELINSACATANTLHQYSPDVLKHVVTEFVNTLDLYEIEESVTWISRDLTQTFKPVIQTVLPVVLKDVITCLVTDTNDNSEQIMQMRTLLRQFIMNEEMSQ